MRIYLDNCCYNRPYDDQEFVSIHLETLAKLHIQDQIRNNVYELATSDMLYYEVSQIPHAMHRLIIKKFIQEYSAVHAGIQNLEEIEEIVHGVMETGIKYKDAFHVASAPSALALAIPVLSTKSAIACICWSPRVINVLSFKR